MVNMKTMVVPVEGIATMAKALEDIVILLLDTRSMIEILTGITPVARPHMPTMVRVAEVTMIRLLAMATMVKTAEDTVIRLLDTHSMIEILTGITPVARPHIKALTAT